MRSCLRLALARFASASATCDRLAATAWSAVRASMRTSTCPARTTSPALTLSSTMRPATCAPSVACFTASTTPSAAMVCAISRTATSSVGPTPAAAGGACAPAGEARRSAAISIARRAFAPPAASDGGAPGHCRPHAVLQVLMPNGRYAGHHPRAPVARRPIPIRPHHRALPSSRNNRRKQAQPHHDAHNAIDTADVLFHEELPTVGIWS